MKKVNYISASQIGEFVYCPISFKLNYLDGIPKPPPNIFMIYGSAIHKALEVNYRQKIKTTVDLPAKEVVAVFRETYMKECVGYYLTGSRFFLEYLNIGADALTRYMKIIAHAIQPLHVEYKFEIPLKHYPITILGFIDVITTDGIIIDHKTAGKNYKKEWNFKRVDDSIQATFYAAAYRKLFAKKEKGVRFDIIPRMKDTDFLQLMTQRTDEQVLHILELASVIEQIVTLGVFTPNLANCSKCPIKNTCNKMPYIHKK